MTNIKHVTLKALSMLLTAALMLSLVVVPAVAAEPTAEAAQGGSFVNTSGDGGADAISLTAARSFKATVPVDMTAAEAEAIAGEVVWVLNYDESAGYLDPEQYPNHVDTETLEGWTALNGDPLFTNIVTTVESTDDGVCLVVTFDSGMFFKGTRYAETDATGLYLDYLGYFDLEAQVDGEVVGSVNIKINAYDEFHTMTEIYAEIDEIVAFAAENTDIYVEKFSMGMSAGDNGLPSLDMPYLIIAKDKAATEKWLEIAAKAESDPTALLADIESGAIGDYQVPVMFSNIHANETAAPDGILGFAWMLVETAASETGTVDYDMLTGFTAEGEAELANQLGEAGVEGSVAIPDLVADKSTYLGYIRAEKGGNSAPVDLEKYYTIETNTVDIDAMLADIFFIIVPEENVEGRTYLSRTSSGGLDLNRDNSFQTQEETINMTKLIGTWNPVLLTEFHSMVKTYQFEPCDPPHEPNFEYDLLAEHLMPAGEALAIAAVANNDGYNSYVIPQRDYLVYSGETNEDGSYQTVWADPWDDMSTSYTPQYSMLHGTVAYTVEVPGHNDDVVESVIYGQLGQSDYVAQNKESFLVNQTKIYERGVTNANSNETVGPWFTDQYDNEGAEADLFRPIYDGEGQNGNFYPECYIIPLDGVNQSNLDAADQMIAYLLRNDVDVMIADEAFTYGGVEYPAGTAVISMYQAKRSVANGVLYDGTVISEWPVLYSEGITAFSYTRGFDMAVCAEPAAYETIAAACSVSDEYTVGSSFIGSSEDTIVLLNSSEDSTAAVNALLHAGKTVSIITEGEYSGSFIVSYEDYTSIADSYLVSAVSVEEAPASIAMTHAPVLYITGKPADDTTGFVKYTLVSGAYNYNYDRQSMELLGFETTDDPAKADVIIGASAPDAAALEAIKNGTPYIAYGSSVANTVAGLFAEGSVARSKVSSRSMDALAHVSYPTAHPVTASYAAEGDNIMYGYGAGYFTAIPEGAEVLVTIDGTQAALEGFLVSGEGYDAFFDSSVQAFAYEGEGADGSTLDIVVFANSLTHKIHQRDEFNFISNFAFNAVTEAEDATAAETASRAVLVGKIHEFAGKPSAAAPAPFTDVDPDSPYAAAIDWAYMVGITNGTSATTFEPDAALTREQAVTMLWRCAKLVGIDVSVGENTNILSYEDYDEISEYAIPAMQWACGAGITIGTSETTLSPKEAVTLEQIDLLVARVVAGFLG